MPRPTFILLLAATAIAVSPTVVGAQVPDPPVKILPDWSYQPLYDRAASAENLFEEGTVKDSSGQVIGDIENIIFSDRGKALAIIANLAGTADRGEIHVSIPWDKLEFGNNQTDVNVKIDASKITEYTGFDPSGIVEKKDVASLGTVEQDQAMDLGENVFQARDLIGDHAYLGDNKRWGYINDLVIREGKLVGIVVEVSDENTSRHFAAPFDQRAGVNPGDRRYRPPLNENAIQTLGEFDYDRFRKRN